MKKWDSAKSIFSMLNENYEYLVIRNFEGFFDSILLDSHADIDILIRRKDRTAVVAALGASPRLSKNDGIHYQVSVAGECIAIDLRTVGDGYFDKNWEKEMLDSRWYDSVGFYRMNPTHYYWSLLYHALYHKGKISKEYRSRLDAMKVVEEDCSSTQLELKLADYMRERGFYYTICKDRYLWYHFTDVCSDRIQAYPLYPLVLFGMKCKEYIDRKIKMR